MRIGIVGMGHMGSWFAKELGKENEVAVYDVENERTERIKKAKVLSTLSELSFFSPQLLINAVSLKNTIETFREVEKYLPDECILSDVASIKEDISVYYSENSFRFVSVHPMFGPTFANVDSLHDENVVIIKESDREGARIFKEFFQELGLNIFNYSFSEHDKMMAYSLNLPFVASLVFSGCIDRRIVPGTTFKKHLTIAKGLLSEDDHLLAEILFNEHSLPQIEKITNRIEFLKHIIRAKDFEEVQKFLKKLRKNVKDSEDDNLTF